MRVGDVEGVDLQAEITGQRRDRQREHEAVVEAIRQQAERDRRDQEVRRPAVEDREARFSESESGREHRSEEHTSELQSQSNLVCRLLLEKKNEGRSPRGTGSLVR